MFQDIEQYLSAENRKESDVVNVRLENIKLKNKLKKKEHQLKSKVSLVTNDNYSKIPILRPPLGLSKSGLKDHFWTVPKVVSNQRYTGGRK